MTKRPAWAEISVSAIEGNVRTIADIVGPGAGICAVVKSEAYGHGATAVARAALAGGATMLAVALVEEGRRLREDSIDVPILVLGAPQADEAAAIVKAGLEASVFSEKVITAFSEAARNSGTKARLHLKIETGMTRIGCRPEDAPGLASIIDSLPGIELAGVYSHFANADDPDKVFALEQLGIFRSAVSAIEGGGVSIPLRHMANSAAALWLPEARLDLVRIGIAMYGLRPDARRPLPRGFREAMTVKAKVTRISTVPPGSSVSYGRTWTATRATRVATVPIGYADGLPRLASGRAWAGFKGRSLAQIGRICMDMCMFDATEAPDLVEGDELAIMGPGGPSLDEIASLAGTINYEIACHAGLRLPHVATKDGA